jgi:hypothetical protein
MILSDATREEFLAEHIPNKLAAIDFGGFVADFLERYGSSHPTTIQIGSAATMQMKDAALFTNAVVEHGVMSCRAMLECLGIGLNNTLDGIADYRKQGPHTVTLQHFDRELITAAQVTDYLKRDRVLMDGLVKTLREAHRGGAHLTMGGVELAPKPLKAGCSATRTLVDHFLYRALGRPAPKARIRLPDPTAT